MDQSLDPTPARRREGLDRLRRVTAGVAVAGVAATAGVGVLAAMTYSGTSDAATPTGDPAATAAPDPGTVTNPDAAAPQDDDRLVVPNDGFGQGGFAVPNPGRGPGHAATGGS